MSLWKSKRDRFGLSLLNHYDHDTTCQNGILRIVIWKLLITWLNHRKVYPSMPRWVLRMKSNLAALPTVSVEEGGRSRRRRCKRITKRRSPLSYINITKRRSKRRRCKRITKRQSPLSYINIIKIESQLSCINITKIGSRLFYLYKHNKTMLAVVLYKHYKNRVTVVLYKHNKTTVTVVLYKHYKNRVTVVLPL